MHAHFQTKHIFGFGPAFVTVAAEELQDPRRFRCEAFVGFPRTSHPARTACNRLIYRPPADPVDPLANLPIDVTGMYEEGIGLAHQLLVHFQEMAYEKSRDSSWLEELVLTELSEAAVKRTWAQGYYRKAFKSLLDNTRVASLRDQITGIQSVPFIKRED